MSTCWCFRVGVLVLGVLAMWFGAKCFGWFGAKCLVGWKDVDVDSETKGVKSVGPRKSFISWLLDGEVADGVQIVVRVTGGTPHKCVEMDGKDLSCSFSMLSCFS